jgi:hypothetical protein
MMMIRTTARVLLVAVLTLGVLLPSATSRDLSLIAEVSAESIPHEESSSTAYTVSGDASERSQARDSSDEEFGNSDSSVSGKSGDSWLSNNFAADGCDCVCDCEEQDLDCSCVCKCDEEQDSVTHIDDYQQAQEAEALPQRRRRLIKDEFGSTMFSMATQIPTAGPMAFVGEAPSTPPTHPPVSTPTPPGMGMGMGMMSMGNGKGKGKGKGKGMGMSMGMGMSQAMGMMATGKGKGKGKGKGMSMGMSQAMSMGMSQAMSMGMSQAMSMGMSQGMSMGMSQGMSMGMSMGNGASSNGSSLRSKLYQILNKYKSNGSDKSKMTKNRTMSTNKKSKNMK